MKTFDLPKNIDSNKIFLINRSELNYRIDPIYYNSVNKLYLVNNTKYPIKKLGEVTIMQRGRFGHRPRNDPDYFDGEYPFIQTGNVVEASKSNGRINYTQTLNELGLSTSRLFQPNVLVITIAANIGDTAILDYPACFPDSLIALHPKGDINIYYLNYYLKFIKSYIESLAPQSAQKNINLQQLNPIPVIVPPKLIQESVVEILTNAYKCKQEKEFEAKALLESIDSYLLDELGIKLPEYNNALKNRILTTMFSSVTGRRLDSVFFKTKHYKVEGGVYANEKLKHIALILRGQSITKEKITQGEFPVIAGGQSSPYNHDKCNHKGNVITVSASGAYSGFVWYHDYPIFASDCCVIKSKDEKKISTLFLSEILKLKQKEIYFLQQGAGQPHVYGSDLGELQIPIPNPEKQVEIEKYIQNIRVQATELQQRATKILEDAKREVESIILGE